jgi:CubicO group peptidase (beta-lactamase class C family)
MRRRDFLALSGAMLAARPAWAKGDWARDFGDYISDQLALTNTPGMSVAMVRGGRTAFSAGYGYADVEKAKRVTPDTIFQIASVSKTVTATALMLLWEEGAYKLDDPITPHLDFKVVHPKFPDVPITFRHLFTHTSGISDVVYDDLDFATGELPSLRDFLASYLVPGGKLYNADKCYSVAKPGTVWSYSNVAVALLGYLGERLSGKSLDVFTRERIFAPLCMRDTSWRYEGVADARLAQPYDFENAHFKRLPHTRYPDWPAGLLCTSANDFARFLASYSAGGHALLKPETIKTMFTPDPVVVNPKSPNLQQGLIWELAPMDGGTVALHPGGDPGASTLAAIDIAHGSAALCFANITPTKDKLPFAKDVIRRLLKKANA